MSDVIDGSGEGRPKSASAEVLVTDPAGEAPSAGGSAPLSRKRGFSTATEARFEPIAAEDDAPLPSPAPLATPSGDARKDGSAPGAVPARDVAVAGAEAAGTIDPSRICPSKYCDSSNAAYTFLEPRHSDGVPRDFDGDFKLRLVQYRRDVMDGILPPEAVLYDFPDELRGKTPEEIKEFFDRMVSSTGIGADQPDQASSPLGLHPFLSRLVRRFQSPEASIKRFLQLKADLAERKRREAEESAARQTAESRSLKGDASHGVTFPPGSTSPVERHLRVVPKESPAAPVSPRAGSDAPMGLEGIPRRAATGSGRDRDREASTEAAPVSSLRSSPGNAARVPPAAIEREPREASWRLASEADSAALAAMPGSMATGAAQFQPPFHHFSAPRHPVGLLTGLLSGAGKLADGLGNAVGSTLHRFADAMRGGPSDAGRGALDMSGAAFKARMGQASGGDALDTLEADCDRLVELAAMTREAAGQGGLADALGRLRELAGKRGITVDQAWAGLHSAAKGANADPETVEVALRLSEAIEQAGMNGPLREMMELRQRIDGASRAIIRREESSALPDEAALHRVKASMERLKEADAAFEKPGDDGGLREIRKMAERFAEAIKSLMSRLFGPRHGEGEDVPAPGP